MVSRNNRMKWDIQILRDLTRDMTERSSLLYHIQAGPVFGNHSIHMGSILALLALESGSSHMGSILAFLYAPSVPADHIGSILATLGEASLMVAIKTNVNSSKYLTIFSVGANKNRAITLIERTTHYIVLACTHLLLAVF